jgi:hypothetical protein
MAIRSYDQTNILPVQPVKKVKCTKLLAKSIVNTQYNHTGIVKTAMMEDGSLTT